MRGAVMNYVIAFMGGWMTCTLALTAFSAWMARAEEARRANRNAKAPR